MKPKIEIAPMELSDINDVYKLGLSTSELQIDKNHPAYYPKDTLRNIIKIDEGIGLVAKVDGKFAGFCIANYHPWYKEGYLSDTVVLPKYRKLGIGKKLFEEKVKILKKKGARWFWALIQEDNKFMQNFIEKEGFKQGGKFYYYYKKG